MIVLSLGVFFRGFNASKFVLYLCVLSFVIILALRLDGIISISYTLVFVPLFVCNAIALLGAIIGTISFIVHRPPPSDIVLRIDFLAMLMTTLQHAFLCIFEYLVASKLDGVEPSTSGYVPWSVIFAPLFLQSCLAIFISIWAVRHERSFELELFFSVNIVQFVFISFKLDKQVDWSWAVVFIPMWVVLSLAVVGVLYALILAVLLARSRHLLPSHRRNNVYGAVLQTFLVVPALTSLVLLSGKLDDPRHVADDVSYVMVLLPLGVSLFFLLLMSFASRGGNVWWFALRRPFCSFLLDTCPCLRQYANVSYKVGGGSGSQGDSSTPPPLVDEERPLRTVVPVTTIESVD